MHCIEHGQDLFPALAFGQVGVHAQHFIDLPADRFDRVEGRHRFLEHHSHAGGPHLPQSLLAGSQDVFAVDQNRAAAGGEPPFGQQPHDRKGGHRFAGARFADNAECFAGIYVKADVLGDILGCRNAHHAHSQVVDDQDRPVFADADAIGFGID